jgi:hypothetical protein
MVPVRRMLRPAGCAAVASVACGQQQASWDCICLWVLRQVGSSAQAQHELLPSKCAGRMMLFVCFVVPVL